MNLVLFEPDELQRPLPRTDRRAIHVLEVLRRKVGDVFDAGVIDGPRGKATVTAVSTVAVEFSFSPTTAPTAPIPITLLVGLPRPQTARDILRDATSVGVGALHFVRTEKAEPSYAQSTLWTSGEWRRHVVAGAEQAFDPRIPSVAIGESLAETLTALSPSCRLALDNYESAQSLAEIAVAPGAPVTIAIGAERGWSATERDLLRRHDFAFVHLGPRVLRTETAVIATLTLVHAKRA